jgi:hypothetical protein
MSDCLNRYWHQFLASLPAEAERPLGFGEPIAFGFTAKDATEISKLVLDQIKTATGSVLWSYEADGKALPQMGDFCSPRIEAKSPRFVSRGRDLTLGSARGYVSRVWKEKRKFQFRTNSAITKVAQLARDPAAHPCARAINTRSQGGAYAIHP